jgi:hypothetical protein
MKRLLIALTAALAFSAQAQYINGNMLHSYFQGTVSDRQFALGYVGGVVDALDDELFCIPSKANLGQLRDIVQQFLTNNPSVRQQHGAALVAVALMEVFPCKKGGGV